MGAWPVLAMVILFEPGGGRELVMDMMDEVDAWAGFEYGAAYEIWGWRTASCLYSEGTGERFPVASLSYGICVIMADI